MGNPKNEVKLMTTASHYVFMDLKEMIKNEKYAKLHEISMRYSNRYNKDEELQRVCNDIMTSLAADDYSNLEEIRKDLEQLISTRKLQTGGGTGLWFENRR